jgi:hypothetical protein
MTDCLFKETTVEDNRRPFFLAFFVSILVFASVGRPCLRSRASKLTRRAYDFSTMIGDQAYSPFLSV